MLRLAYFDNGHRVFFELKPGVHLVGRAEGCDLRIADPSISSQHLRLDVKPDGRVEFRDLMSSNGTFLDQSRKRVDAGKLSAGGVLRLGRLAIEVEAMDGESARPDAPAAGPPIEYEDIPVDSSRTPVAPLPPVVPAPSAAAPLQAGVASGTPGPGRRAMLVLPPGQQHLPPYAASARADEQRRKSMMIAVGAAVVLAAAALLLAPARAQPNRRSENDRNGQDPAFDYSKLLREGEAFFRRQEYRKAWEVWNALDKLDKERGRVDSEAANVFAQAAMSCLEIREGRQASEPWTSLGQRLRKVQEEDSREAAEFARFLRGQFSRESTAEKAYARAVEHFRREAFEAAESDLASIPSESVYAARADEMRREMESARRAQDRARAYAAARDGRYAEAVALGERVLRLNDGDGPLAADLELWRGLIRWEELEKEFVLAEAAGGLPEVINAIERIFPQFPENFVEERNLAPVRERLKLKRAAMELSTLFDAWDLEQLPQALEREKDNSHPLVAQLRGRFRAAGEAREAYRQAEAEEDFSRMQEVVDGILAMDGFSEQHPLTQWAKSKSRSREAIGEAWLASAAEAWQKNRMADARRRLRMAQKTLEFGDLGAISRRLRDVEGEIAKARALIEQRRKPSGTEIDRLQAVVDELTAESEQLREKLQGRGKEQFLLVRRNTIEAARRFLNSRSGDPAGELARARDCTLYHAEDEEARDLYEAARQKYSRDYKRDMPPPSTPAVED